MGPVKHLSKVYPISGPGPRGLRTPGHHVTCKGVKEGLLISQVGCRCQEPPFSNMATRALELDPDSIQEPPRGSTPQGISWLPELSHNSWEP